VLYVSRAFSPQCLYHHRHSCWYVAINARRGRRGQTSAGHQRERMISNAFGALLRHRLLPSYQKKTFTAARSAVRAYSPQRLLPRSAGASLLERHHVRWTLLGGSTWLTHRTPRGRRWRCLATLARRHRAWRGLWRRVFTFALQTTASLSRQHLFGGVSLNELRDAAAASATHLEGWRISGMFSLLSAAAGISCCTRYKSIRRKERWQPC